MRHGNKLISLLFVIGYGLGPILLSGCADELDQVMEVDKFRIMGVSVEPPEIRPEHTGPVEIRVLWHDPHGDGRSVEFAWVFCLGEVPTATGYQYCELLDPKALPPIITAAEEGGDVFAIPFVPTELFDMIPEGEAFPVSAIILMCAGGELPAADTLLDNSENTDINALCDGGDAISAYKTILFANGSGYGDEANANPEITEVVLNGTVLTPSDPYYPDATVPDTITCSSDDGCNLKLEVSAAFSVESYQDYTVMEFGEPVEEMERPYISWYATGGELSMPHSTSDSPEDLSEVFWNPKEPGEYLFWTVANDRRGGIAWREFHVVVEE